jgi:hypothetical protein
MKVSILIKYNVAMSLIQLISENSLQLMDDLLEVVKSIFLMVLK